MVITDDLVETDQRIVIVFTLFPFVFTLFTVILMSYHYHHSFSRHVILIPYRYILVPFPVTSFPHLTVIFSCLSPSRHFHTLPLYSHAFPRHPIPFSRYPIPFPRHPRASGDLPNIIIPSKNLLSVFYDLFIIYKSLIFWREVAI